MATTPDFYYERYYGWNRNRIVVGIDEVGNGAIAGPFKVGAVVFPINLDPQLVEGVNDCKKIPRSKLGLYERKIQSNVLWRGVHGTSARDFERLGQKQATLKAVRVLLTSFLMQTKQRPGAILVDGGMGYDFLSDHNIPTINIPGGDKLSLSIAAASIIAKVSHDNEMELLHDLYPVYGFKNHNGYGTKKHIEAIQAHGLSPEHREKMCSKFFPFDKKENPLPNSESQTQE